MAIGTAGRQPSAKQRAGARAEHKQRTRTAIHQAAMKLFAAQGYAKTTVEQIAEEAQVSHTTFFRYFGSKELVVISDDLHDARPRCRGSARAVPPGAVPTRSRHSADCPPRPERRRVRRARVCAGPGR